MKLKPGAKTETRIHMDTPLAQMKLKDTILSFLYKYKSKITDPTIILCIGTDRSTGDALGPLVGTKLTQYKLPYIRVYGNLDNPVHAANLDETIAKIHTTYHYPFIIAIDAGLGRHSSVGMIDVKDGPLKPGTGVNKELTPVGNMHLTGLVNIGGYMEYFVLQSTRLSLVMKMADIIAYGIQAGIREFFQKQAQAE
ncbi:spore protease YyaC [Anoxybacter fermentans]|uniref:Spore protease YyaC n=1 Tax=Anoxybacter fermentans TaxID=1323375 RepID=A0A3S9T1A5_9FIRM|nr:spore protease YyaC [Anoxybacter fermentans]AZR74285.1 spore protease YyaC [Anoxybacter fermentans]